MPANSRWDLIRRLRVKQQSSYNDSIIYSIYLAAEIITKEGKTFTDSDLRRVFRNI